MRFGPRTSGGSVHPTGIGRAPGVYPPNVGAGKSAQHIADTLAAASARKQQEAISNIDSVLLYLWQPMTHGALCACQGGKPLPIPNADPNVLGSGDGNEPSVNDGEDDIKVVAYDVTPAYHHTELHTPFVSDAEPAHHYGMTTDADVLGLADDPLPDPTHGAFATNYNGGPGHNPQEHEWDDGVGASFSEELLDDFDLENAWNPEDVLAANAYVLGEQTTACAICYNKGYIGGYDLWGGTHRVLESTATPYQSQAYIVDAAAAIPVFEVEPGGYLLWTTALPSYFTVAWALARNNRQATLGFQLEFSLDNVSYTGDLNSLKALSLSTLYVRATNVSNNPLKLTHVAIAVMHMPLLGQVTNLTTQAGTDQLMKADGITVTLPAQVGIIDRNSLVSDVKYRLTWRVQSVDTISDHKLRVTSVSSSTKLVMSNEVESAIYPFYYARLSPQKLYDGTEPIQGNR